MDILSVSFIIFIVKLSFAIIPFVIALRLLTFSHEKKIDIKNKLGKKLLGDPTLLTLSAFSLILKFLAAIFFLAGILASLILYFYLL